MLNWALFTPRNFVVIGALALLAQALYGQVFKAIDKSPDTER